jgi:hypothetical protein
MSPIMLHLYWIFATDQKEDGEMSSSKRDPCEFQWAQLNRPACSQVSRVYLITSDSLYGLFASSVLDIVGLMPDNEKFK